MEHFTNYDSRIVLVLIIVLTFYECTFIGFYLIFKKAVRYQANRYLGGILLIPASVILPSFLFQLRILDELPHVIHIHFVTYLLFGPLVYFYVRACTQKGFKLKPILWLHFIPALVALIYFMPFYLQSGQEKFEAYLIWRETASLGVPRWVLLIRLFHATIYFVICAQLITIYKRHLVNATSYIDTIFHRRLLYCSGLLLLPALAAINLLSTTNTLDNRLIAGTIFFSLILTLIFALSVRLAILFKPSLFHEFPHQMPIPNSTEEQKQRYEKSTLQDDKKDFYVKKLILFMETEKPYLTPDLTLADLSKQVDIPAHYLSQTINEKLKCNFVDYINQYRIKEAQAMLVNPKLKHYTVVAIAHEAGFNAKSTFYTAFKKYVKMTPSQYKKQEIKANAIVSAKKA